jgi:glycosyltransferase involved in cell wall biosynthesis
MTRSQSRLIKIFTPSDAAVGNTNAQNLTVKEVVARLPADRFHVTMLCDSDEADPRLSARANTRLVPWTRHGNTIRLLRHCLLPSPDIYYFPRTGPLDQIFFDLRNRMGLKTAVVTYIVMAMDHTTGAGLIGRSVAEADVVVGNSCHVVETIEHEFGVQAETIYDGIDRRYYYPPHDLEHDLVEPDRVEKQSLVVLYAGSFQPRKRVELIVGQAVRWPNVQFRLAGKGETEASCRELAQRIDCRNVSFLGHLSSQQLGDEMRNADIFLFPSILEGNPQVLLQAGACGLPAVAMALYRSDYVVNTETGFLAGSDAELAQGLDRLLNDAALRASFSAAAVRHTQQFNWDEIAAQWAAVFERALAKRHAIPRQKAS